MKLLRTKSRFSFRWCGGGGETNDLSEKHLLAQIVMVVKGKCSELYCTVLHLRIYAKCFILN